MSARAESILAPYRVQKEDDRRALINNRHRTIFGMLASTKGSWFYARLSSLRILTATDRLALKNYTTGSPFKNVLAKGRHTPSNRSDLPLPRRVVHLSVAFYTQSFRRRSLVHGANVHQDLSESKAASTILPSMCWSALQGH